MLKQQIDKLQSTITLEKEKLQQTQEVKYDLHSLIKKDLFVVKGNSH